jgi:hypothetical protein
MLRIASVWRGLAKAHRSCRSIVTKKGLDRRYLAQMLVARGAVSRKNVPPIGCSARTKTTSAISKNKRDASLLDTCM